MNIDDMIEIANFLGKNDDTVKLCNMKGLNDNRKFYLTVWGHYSAGKSRLLNNILNKDILPVGNNETTACLTYIQYGKSEKCLLVEKDGNSREIEIGGLKKIYENALSVDQKKEIDHIEVYLDNPLLETGLVLVDTPGINTIIQRHEDIAVDAIEQSGRIIYVLGGAPTQVDKKFINMISDCGIQIFFVRTKCDGFRDIEENCDEALQKEKDYISALLDCEIKFIPVSNEKNNKWYDNISKVQLEVNNISNDLISQIENAEHEKLCILAQQYLSALIDQKKQLSEATSGNTKQLETQIEDCNQYIGRIENLYNKQCSDIQKYVDKANKQCKLEMEERCKKEDDRFKQAIGNIEYSSDIETEIAKKYDNLYLKSVQGIKTFIESFYDEVLRENQIDLDSAANISDSIPPTYSEVQQDNLRSIELYKRKLLEISHTLEQCKEEKAAIDQKKNTFDDSEYNLAIAELQKEYNEIPSDVAMQVVDDQNVKPSRVFKGVGNAADLLLLLIPGDTIVEGIKATANTTKIAQVVNKFGKAGKAILNSGSRSANVIDKVRDTAYTVNTIFGRRGYSTVEDKRKVQAVVDNVAESAGNSFNTMKENKRNGNVLDMLSVAYWTEKFGKQFDKPPRMEIDEAVQIDRDNMREEIKSKMSKINQESLQKKRELGVIQTQEEELEYRKKENEIMKEKIETELAEKESRNLDSIRNRSLEIFRQKYIDYFDSNIRYTADSISNEIYKLANGNISMYISTHNSDLNNAIIEKKDQLQKLLEMKDSDRQKVKEMMNKYDSYISLLEGANNNENNNCG